MAKLVDLHHVCNHKSISVHFWPKVLQWLSLIDSMSVGRQLYFKNFWLNVLNPLY